jgi:hypothetical protein
VKLRLIRFATFCCFAALLITTGCKKSNTIGNPDFKYDYYPLDSGWTVEYEMESIRYSFLNPGVQIDTLHYFIKEVIGDTFTDDIGQINYRIWRFRKDSINAPWQIDRAWSLLTTSTNLQKNEDGLRYIKLVFPPRQGRQWNGNSYIDALYNDPFSPSGFEYLFGWEYELTEVDIPFMLNGFSFDSTLTVLQADDENLLEKTYSEERYAKGVGLIYKKLVHLTTQRVDPISQQLPFEEKAENGFILTVKVTDFY